MLSKFFFYKSEEKFDKGCIQSSILSQVQVCFPEAVDIQPVKGGTLGILFTCSVAGKKKIIKTHIGPESARSDQYKEAQIMLRQYGEALHVELRETSSADRIFLMMDFLEDAGSVPIGEQDIMQLLQQAQKNLLPYQTELQKLVDYSMTDVLEAAHYSLAGLVDVHELQDPALLRKISCSQQRVCDVVSADTRKKVICHGDCSNKNILSRGCDRFLLDWEDALTGPEDYDFLYWLTFFGQRKILSPRLLEKYGICPQYACDIMASILLVKAFLSCKNGTNQTNSLTNEDRLVELYKIMGM